MRIAAVAALVAIGGGLSIGALAQERVLAGAEAYGDWSRDAPGVWHKITPADLPPPNQTESARNASRPGAGSDTKQPKVPPGFSVSAFAQGFEMPRQMKIAPNGDIFLADSGADEIRILRAAPGSAKAASNDLFAKVPSRPYGIAFYPPGPNPEYVYVATMERLVRFPYRVGDTKARGVSQTIIADLPSGGHWTRDVIVAPDGQHLFLAIGSSSNIQDNGESAERWRADIVECSPLGSGRRIFAAGLRNPVTLALNPLNGALWTSVNERDLLGDNLPPDYVTHVEDGKFYGWPYFYIGNHRDARVRGTPPVPGEQVAIPDVLIQPHSAPLGIAFYTGTQFPADYRNDLFVAVHGSWNRVSRTGYKLIRVKFKDGRATGEYQDFMTGFVTGDGQVWGRPVGVAMAQDGALLMSDDGSHTIWRIAYSGAGR